MNQNLQDQLLSEIVWSATRQGAFQKSKIYNSQVTVSDKDKSNFRKYLKDYCYTEFYKKLHKKKISEENLIEIIRKLISETSEKFKPILKDGELQFGNAQKFVNLYLKSLWVMGRIEEPPHFPLDRLIQTGFKSIKSWTDMNEKEYLDVIECAKKAKNNPKQGLAIWEAQKYLQITNKNRAYS